MTHFGVICPGASGHINPMAALGRELQRRGHRITFLLPPDAESRVRSEGLDFQPVGASAASEAPGPSAPTQTTPLISKSVVGAIEAFGREAAVICSDAPAAIEAIGVEALIVDQSVPSGGTVAERLGLPFVTVCCALLLNCEASIPPIFTGWSYRDNWWARLRNRAGYRLLARASEPHYRVVNEYRRLWKLPAYRSPDDANSRLAQICQQPAALDFPRTALPDCFHYVGPLRNTSPRAVPFPYERLDGRPLIYASLGTMQNRRERVFQRIAQACAALDVQLVLSHGGGMRDEAVRALPGSPLVVSYAPQLELLARAKLTITHAGLNTVLDALSNGVPLVAIPIAHEQPAIAARIRWTGTGEVVPFKRLSVRGLQRAIERVLERSSYSERAARLQESIQQSGGVVRACDIIERAIVTRQPVF